MSNRIYIVKQDKKERLVRAVSAAAAIRHVSYPMFEARVASQQDLVNLIGQGVKVEEAGPGNHG